MVYGFVGYDLYELENFDLELELKTRLLKINL